MVKRIETLDYLRGTLALSILAYHYTIWAKITPDLSSPLSRVGVYGVAVFYILSGLTHYMVHKDKVRLTGPSLWEFAVKRFFRIMPLLWLIMALTLLVSSKPKLDAYTLLLNYTALFGFIDPTNYVAVGAWSIGNEMVYYALFPVLVAVIRFNQRMLLLLFVLSLVWAMFVSFFWLTPAKVISAQWSVYVNPFTNLVFFIGGMYISTLSALSTQLSPLIKRILLVALITAFFFIPLEGNQINFIYGPYRLVYLLIVLGICAVLFIDDFVLPKPLHHLLKFLAASSYSIYLWHPVLFMTVGKLQFEMGWKLPIEYVLGIAFILTMPISHYSAKYIETYGAKLGQLVLGGTKKE